jgi:hypothetical protein
MVGRNRNDWNLLDPAKERTVITSATEKTVALDVAGRLLAACAPRVPSSVRSSRFQPFPPILFISPG